MGPGDGDEKKPHQSVIVPALKILAKMPPQPAPSGKDAIKLGLAAKFKVGNTSVGEVGFGVALNAGKGLVGSSEVSLGSDKIGGVKGELSVYAKDNGELTSDADIAVKKPGIPVKQDTDLIISYRIVTVNLSEVKRNVEGLIHFLTDYASTAVSEMMNHSESVPNGKR